MTRVDPARLGEGYPGGRLGAARRATPAELARGGVDLDLGAVWAVYACASSQWGQHGSWWAPNCVGRPTVWPKHGDRTGAWAPSASDSPSEWIEVRFDPAPPARAIRVFETNDAGATFAVAVDDGDELEVVWLDRPTAIRNTACMLEVELSRPRPIKRVRVWVDGTPQESWPEIDAIGLVLDALEPLPPAPPPAALEPPHGRAGRARRYSAAELRRVDPAASSRGLFPIAARASSEFSASWGAAQLVGRPDVWPDYGDRPGAWAPRRGRSALEWVEVDFPPSEVPTRAIRVFETNVAGSTARVAIVGARGEERVVFEAPAEHRTDGARVLEIELEELAMVRRLRVTVDNSHGGWSEIDTVAILPVPTGDPYRGAPPGRGPVRRAGLHERLMSGFDGERVGVGRRFGVLAMLAHDWQVGWRGSWPVAATASSSWGRGWAASNARGKPGIYPLSGDLPGAWAPRPARGGVEWLEVDFGSAILARGVRVFETCRPGAVFALVLDGTTLVWADAPFAGAGADVLEVTLKTPRRVRTVRAYLDNDASPSWSEIDSIGLLRAE